MSELGYVPYRLTGRNKIRVPQVMAVIEEYEDVWPLSVRQVLYVMISRHRWTKKDSDPLGNILDRLRRADMIPWESITDHRFVERWRSGVYDDDADFYGSCVRRAEQFRLDRQTGQKRFIELWCEAIGMVPQLVEVAHDYGVPVYSGGGNPSITGKRAAAVRFAERPVPTTVLHIGDHDYAGWSIFRNLRYDIPAFMKRHDPSSSVEFVRLAALDDQIDELPASVQTRATGDTMPADATRYRDIKVEAEAIPPDFMRDIVTSGIESRLSLKKYRKALKTEAQLRELVTETARRMG